MKTKIEMDEAPSQSMSPSSSSSLQSSLPISASFQGAGLYFNKKPTATPVLLEVGCTRGWEKAISPNFRETAKLGQTRSLYFESLFYVLYAIFCYPNCYNDITILCRLILGAASNYYRSTSPVQAQAHRKTLLIEFCMPFFFLKIKATFFIPNPRNLFKIATFFLVYFFLCFANFLCNMILFSKSTLGARCEALHVCIYRLPIEAVYFADCKLFPVNLSRPNKRRQKVIVE